MINPPLYIEYQMNTNDQPTIVHWTSDEQLMFNPPLYTDHQMNTNDQHTIVHWTPD